MRNWRGMTPSRPLSASLVMELLEQRARRRQLAAGGLLREPAPLDDARPDQDVPRQREHRASPGIPSGDLTLVWSFGEALT